MTINGFELTKVSDSYGFHIGQLYSRREDLHFRYGGQRQGGISTPARWPIIFLFTGDSGHQYGYEDGYDDSGVFLYTGEGQLGDMEFVRGNKEVRDHIKNGKDLLLFRSLGKGKPVRYLGSYICNSWERVDGIDEKEEIRKKIVFHLHPLDGQGLLGYDSQSEVIKQRTIAELRAAALEAATEGKEVRASESGRILHARSASVKAYVLARANGNCEACGEPAPFETSTETKYLETHHIRRISDGGPDHPRWVAAVCPNCHREIHFGKNGFQLNEALKEYIGKRESK